MRSTTYPIGTQSIPVLAGELGALVQADGANTADIYLGGQDVTADTTGSGGFRLPAGIAVAVETGQDDILYAISTAAGQFVRVMQGKRPSIEDPGVTEFYRG